MTRRSIINSRAARATMLASAIILLAVLAFVLFARSGKEDKRTASTPYYEIDAVLSEDSKTLELSEDVLYSNQTGTNLTELKFHLYANAFSKDALHSPFSAEEKKTVSSFGGIEVLSAKINRVNCDFELLGEDRTVLSLPLSLADGDTACVSLECRVTLPVCTARFGRTGSTVNLSGFYPVLCRYENGWREDEYTAVGDPFFTDSSDFSVSLDVKENLVACGSGTMTEESSSQGRKLVRFEGEELRDFAVFLSSSYSVCEGTAAVGDRQIAVRYCYLSDQNPSDTLALAASALETFSLAFGEYPYPCFSLAEAPLSSAGMEYGALAVIAPGLNGAKEDTVVHETAHQWWYNAVGSDQINAAWLDEGLTEFCTAYYRRLTGDKPGYDEYLSALSSSYSVWAELPPSVGFSGKMSRPLSEFLTTGEYVAVVYDRGALAFSTVLELVGEEKFNAALQSYFASNCFKIADFNALLSAFSACGGDGILRAYENGNAKI